MNWPCWLIEKRIQLPSYRVSSSSSSSSSFSRFLFFWLRPTSLHHPPTHPTTHRPTHPSSHPPSTTLASGGPQCQMVAVQRVFGFIRANGFDDVAIGFDRVRGRSPPGVIGFSRVSVGFSLVVRSFYGFLWVQAGWVGFLWFTGFSAVFMRFYWVLPSFIGFSGLNWVNTRFFLRQQGFQIWHWVLLGFHGFFYGNFMWFTGFYRVWKGFNSLQRGFGGVLPGFTEFFSVFFLSGFDQRELGVRGFPLVVFFLPRFDQVLLGFSLLGFSVYRVGLS